MNRFCSLAESGRTRGSAGLPTCAPDWTLSHDAVVLVRSLRTPGVAVWKVGDGYGEHIIVTAGAPLKCNGPSLLPTLFALPAAGAYVRSEPRHRRSPLGWTGLLLENAAGMAAVNPAQFAVGGFPSQMHLHDLAGVQRRFGLEPKSVLRNILYDRLHVQIGTELKNHWQAHAGTPGTRRILASIHPCRHCCWSSPVSRHAPILAPGESSPR
jgi:hypothetical protein